MVTSACLRDESRSGQVDPPYKGSLGDREFVEDGRLGGVGVLHP